MLKKFMSEYLTDGLAWYSNTTTLKPCNNLNNLNINELYIEGIDYLQIFCHKSKECRSKRFKMKDLDQPTRLYKKTFLITDEVLNLKVCVLSCEPASPVLPQGAASIKFDNEILYMKFFNRRYILRFLVAIGMEFKYVSRFDIYRDFQKFKEIMPEDLIRNFMQEKYLSLSRAKFNVIGTNNETGLNYEYMRNGKKNTGRQFYLYNKSLELQQVGNKEHIVKTWYDAKFNENVDVWRLELSLTRGKRNQVLNEDTGELEVIGLREVFKKGIIKKTYEAGLRSSFSFVVNQGKRKTRSKRIVLFSKKRKAQRLIFVGGQIDKLRMRRIITKSLIKDIMNDIELREHKSRTINGQIENVELYVTENGLWNHLPKIVWKLSKEYKTECFEDLNTFIYNYWAKIQGY
jgi:hypothetical protein